MLIVDMLVMNGFMMTRTVVMVMIGGKVFSRIYFHFYGGDHDDFIDVMMTKLQYDYK